MTGQTVLLAGKLLKIRNTCRTFYGSGWKAKQEEWKPIIQAVMKAHNCESVLNVAIIMGKQLEGFSLMSCLGTIMEMEENEPNS